MARGDHSRAKTSQAGSFASRHQHLGNGFVAVPRWLLKTPFWSSINAAHRAVILELLFTTTRQDRTWDEAQLLIRRGQCLVSAAKLAKRAGATESQARRAIDNAVNEGLFAREIKTFTTAGQTHKVSLFTWLDFDLYDKPTAHGDKWANESARNSTDVSARNGSTRRSTHKESTHSNYTYGQGESCPYEEIDDV